MHIEEAPSPDIFRERVAIKPYEYPELIDFIHAIDNSAWTVRKFDMQADKVEFFTELNDTERDIIEKTMLAISHIENSVKSFFGRLELRMPKPEVAFVGAKLSGNEVTHSLAYSELLDVLELQIKFLGLQDVPAIRDRTAYLKKYLKYSGNVSNKEFTKALILFTLLVENVSLFSYFLIMASFRKYRQNLKSLGKVIQATAREEIIHAKFGATLINIIRKENPEWFDDEMEAKIRRNVRKAVDSEAKVLDWIFEKGELDFISLKEIKEYLKLRANTSLSMLNYAPEYTLDAELLKKSDFMSVLLEATPDFDFFDSRSSDYDKNRNFSIEDF